MTKKEFIKKYKGQAFSLTDDEGAEDIFRFGITSCFYASKQLLSSTEDMKQILPLYISEMEKEALAQIANMLHDLEELAE